MSVQLIKGNILHFPNTTSEPESDFQYIQNGALVVENNLITDIGTAHELEQRFGNAKVTDYGNQTIVPGFIDTHVHMPQTEMIASFGEQLLDWLNKFTFPTERKFENPEYAAKISDIFLRQLWQNGTTTALAYATVHKSSVDALFEAASKKNMALYTGKVCMDRNCPDWLSDDAESSYSDSADLISKWHNQGRAKYVITPRFAPTSTTEQLTRLGELHAAHPDVYMQTHLSENTSEVEWVKSLYPTAKNYLDVYAQHGLVNQKSIFGHCIYLDDHSWQTMADTGAMVAFCPRSNLFLGSGLYELDKAERLGVKTTLASDVAGGDSFNMLRTMGEAYKVCQLQNITLDPLKGLYLMTQGSANALGMQHEIGNLNPGSYADFTVLNPHFSELSTLRIHDPCLPDDVIFALSMLADERTISATWIAGNIVHER